jgi:hypothetical protein
MKFRFLILFLLIGKIAASQDIIVIGQVFSAEDGLGIENANVWFSGTNIGTTTNEEGYFFLQSLTPQKSVTCSFLGFKTRIVKLDQNKRDQMIEIVLKQEINILDEIIATPSKSDIKDILKKFQQNKDINNPKNISGFSAENKTITKLHLSNIQKKWLQKKIFAELQKGILTENDSNLILPLIFEQNTAKEIYGETTETVPVSTQKNVVECIGKEQLPMILDAYIADVNFYDNNLKLFGKSFVSPASKYGGIYYEYWVVDTMVIDDLTTIYEIRFRPKNRKNLTFDGKFWLEGKNYAITRIEAALPASANLNFVNQLNFSQEFVKIDTAKYFYSSKNQDVSFNYLFPFARDKNYIAAILNRNTQYTNIQLFGNSATLKANQNTTEISDENRQYLSAIDSINHSKIQRVAYTLLDIFMNGYIHCGKVDFGQVWNFVRVNSLEGFRPTFSIRTSEKFNPNFTLGGYIGYGLRDKKMKYGTNFQYVAGKHQQHCFGVFYNNEVYRVGYSDADLLNENIAEASENIFTSFSFGNQYNYLLQEQNLSVRYLFDNKGFRVMFKPEYKEFYPNYFVDFTKNGNQLDKIPLFSATLSFRVSFKEKVIKNFFKNYYFPSFLPVINLRIQGGSYKIDNNAEPFLKLNFTIKQNISLPLGKFNYAFEAGKVFGKMPYFLLYSPLAMQGLWYNSYKFALINQSEFLTDAYVSANLRYYSNGLIFNNIPLINQLNLRETFFINMAWGTVNQKHSQVLDMQNYNSLQTPYIEAGAGITNIFRIFAVESFWRLTNRTDKLLDNWGIRVRFYLDF